MSSQHDKVMMHVDGESDLDLEHASLSKPCRHCAEKSKRSIESLREITEKASIQKLSDAVDTSNISARYCCGGEIILEEDAKVSICFAQPTDESKMWQARLPFDHEAPRRERTTLGKRLHHASDQNGGIEAAPAGSLMTSFDPNGGAGLVDMIAKIMLPGIAEGGMDLRDKQDVVNSSTTEKPILSDLSSSHFGTLAIFLPHFHKGGKWKISTDGDNSTVFSWHKASLNIRWLAFRGHCAFAVDWPSEGSQLVLIYDLNLRVPTATIAKRLYPLSIPIYDIMRKKIEHPKFMEHGGMIGFYLQNPYKHTEIDTYKSYPWVFKGIDMAVWKAFEAMEHEVEFVPLLNSSPMDKFEEEQYLKETAKVKADPGYRSWILDEHNFEDVPCRHCDRKWPGLEQWRKKAIPNVSRIGTAFHPLKTNTRKSPEHRLRSNYFRECLEEDFQADWPHDRLEDIVWLNKPQEREKGCSQSALIDILSDMELGDKSLFGNGEPLEIWESHLVILVKIPKASRRDLLVLDPTDGRD